MIKTNFVFSEMTFSNSLFSWNEGRDVKYKWLVQGQDVLGQIFVHTTIIRSVFPPARWTIRKAIVVFYSTEGGQAVRLTKARINGSRVWVQVRKEYYRTAIEEWSPTEILTILIHPYLLDLNLITFHEIFSITFVHLREKIISLFFPTYWFHTVFCFWFLKRKPFPSW